MLQAGRATLGDLLDSAGSLTCQMKTDSYLAWQDCCEDWPIRYLSQGCELRCQKHARNQGSNKETLSFVCQLDIKDENNPEANTAILSHSIPSVFSDLWHRFSGGEGQGVPPNAFLSMNPHISGSSAVLSTCSYYGWVELCYNNLSKGGHLDKQVTDNLCMVITKVYYNQLNLCFPVYIPNMSTH